MKNTIKFSSFEKNILHLALERQKTIVLPEGELDERVLQAGLYLAKRKICHIVFLAKTKEFLEKYKKGNHYSTIEYLIDEKKDTLAKLLYEKRKEKGMTIATATSLLEDPVYYATMLLEHGDVDGMVCGAIMSTADTLRPGLQIIKGKTPNALISSFMVLVSKDKSLGENGILLLADCAINQNPTAHDLHQIVEDTVTSAKNLGIKNSKVALLSYSTLGSAKGDIPFKMQSVKESFDRPNFVLDGEYQFDSATRPEVARIKAKTGKIQGDANILIFPNLESGNITYKAMCRAGRIQAIGPITQGFRLPINDLSRGATISEIVVTVALTCLQA